MEQTKKIWRSGVKVHEMDSENLRKMWVEKLTDAQRALVVGAGIFPFLKAVTYPCDGDLCAAVIDFMVGGQLTVGENHMQITEEKIREATGLPSAGISVSPSSGYDRADLMLRLTGSTETGANTWGLLLDKILDPPVQFACKFLAYKLLGFQAPGTIYIPFKYVAVAVDVSQGVCFNWCKFVKERMLDQIESVQKGRSAFFYYPTILQYLALKAFGEFCIPRSVISKGDPGINIYVVSGRDAVRSKEEKKKKASTGVSYILYNIIKYHGHRVLSHGDAPEGQSLENMMKRSSMPWEVEKILQLDSENEMLHLERTRLEAALQQMIQINASALEENKEMRMRITRLESAIGLLKAKLKKIREFTEEEVIQVEVEDI